MLQETLDYLKKRKFSNKDFSFELIVVDDGSKDNTSQIAFEWAEKNNAELKVMTLEKNRGKGGAVTRVIKLIYLFFYLFIFRVYWLVLVELYCFAMQMVHQNLVMFLNLKKNWKRIVKMDLV